MKRIIFILLIFVTVTAEAQDFFWSYGRSFFNTQLCDNFTKNDCSSGYVGAPTQVCISAKYFVSGISQADADAKAHEMLYHTNYSGVSGWGQYIANTNGTCAIDPHSYSYLYNWYAATNSRKITSTDQWIVPSSDQTTTLMNAMGGPDVAGANAKMTGFTYWNNTNTGATNAYNFNFVGAGFVTSLDGSTPSYYRDYLLTGGFLNNDREYYEGVYYPYVVFVIATYDGFYIQSSSEFTGMNIRLLKTSTSLTAGQTGTYTGNDGKVYPTIAIGSPPQEWTAMDLAETKYRDGTTIPSKIGMAWTQDVTGARWDSTKIAYNPNTVPPPTVVVPTVNTTAITDITATGATTGVTISSNGNAFVTAKGVCYGTSSNPTIANRKTSSGTGNDAATAYLMGLGTDSLFYVRGYATNSAGTGYGNQLTFTTIKIPTVTTVSATDITTNSLIVNGRLESDGGVSVIYRGAVIGTTANPTTSNGYWAGSGGTNFSSSVTGITYQTPLSPDTPYHVRAFATNSVGTGYGADVTIRTLSVCTRPGGLTNYQLIHTFDGVALTAGNVCFYASLPYYQTSIDWYESYILNKSDGNNVYKLYWTVDSCEKIPDGYYLIWESPFVFTPIRVLNGKLYNINC